MPRETKERVVNALVTFRLDLLQLLDAWCHTTQSWQTAECAELGSKSHRRNVQVWSHDKNHDGSALAANPCPDQLQDNVCWSIRLFMAWAHSTCGTWSACKCFGGPFAPATVCSWPGLGRGQRPRMLPFQLLQQICGTVCLPPSEESRTGTVLKRL